ncbi:hypothetical protein SAMN02745247_01551 [Butyrivibrio hungatei DSM 14810]|jgi:hypothetical protein|uniref:Uncharacterized protein n=1 Tax=Butyrivibrio hungatei DSM 14810 TaxID=1121132 RepID=A0A1M7SDS8_9FIRM|nr:MULTISPECIES: hypothetical protein [Butyrivibrio]MBE5841964.1 hypothetical protein [Butyrivibrio sp.]SHN56677.1 hypothetical protein SAMN02745247_01551 [Butyrivibrio hungatei DSM 14810]
MKIELSHKNEAVCVFLCNRESVVFLDANIFIPPDRTSIGARNAFDFKNYKEIILEPLFDNWKNLAIHESVYMELVDNKVKEYADMNVNDTPPKLKIYNNDQLNEEERSLFYANIDVLAQFSNYQPDLDNSDDRGEVHSLAYMAVKQYLYFSANDHLPIRLITKAEELETGLEHMRVLQMYEIIYILFVMKMSDTDGLRNLYKYMYYATRTDKKVNPSWGDFIEKMDSMYKEFVSIRENEACENAE